MSPTGEKETTQETAKALISLLNEYTEKLRKMSQRARAIQTNHRVQQGRGIKSNLETTRAFDILTNTYYRLMTPVDDLTRESSQLVEHGKLGISTRVELALRLGELEAAKHELVTVVGWGL
jgi:hypothetical protein